MGAPVGADAPTAAVAVRAGGDPYLAPEHLRRERGHRQPAHRPYPSGRHAARPSRTRATRSRSRASSPQTSCASPQTSCASRASRQPLCRRGLEHRSLCGGGSGSPELRLRVRLESRHASRPRQRSTVLRHPRGSCCALVYRHAFAARAAGSVAFRPPERSLLRAVRHFRCQPTRRGQPVGPSTGVRPPPQLRQRGAFAPGPASRRVERDPHGYAQRPAAQGSRMARR
jgi:hypothetical protein